jgi:hypothetical protein
LNPIAVRQVVKAMISAMIGYVSSSKSRKWFFVRELWRTCGVFSQNKATDSS